MPRRSEQQDRVLRFVRERAADGAEHVLFAEILAFLHGWDRTTERVVESDRTFVPDRVVPAAREFDVQAIGESRYRTARASLTRTLRRLEAAGELRRVKVEVPGSFGEPFVRAAVVPIVGSPAESNPLDAKH